jgi:hypothetical protein
VLVLVLEALATLGAVDEAVSMVSQCVCVFLMYVMYMCLHRLFDIVIPSY